MFAENPGCGCRDQNQDDLFPAQGTSMETMDNQEDALCTFDGDEFQ